MFSFAAKALFLRAARGTLCLLPAALVVGCGPGEPDVVHYSAPKEIVVASDPPPASQPGSDRMLAAILLQESRGWFFKLQGPDALVSAHRDEFDGFVKSVHFDAAEPRWNTPAGWRQDPGDSIRFAMLRNDSTPKLEISITALPYSGDAEDYLLQNINRWRGQLQLPPIGRGELADIASKLDTAAGPAMLVDFQGTLSAGGMGRGRGPFAGGIAGPGPIGPAAGPAPDDAVHRAARGGDAAAPGPVASPTAKEEPGRMLAAIVVQSGAGWFFKLLGPADAVASHAGEFDEFVASLRFVGAASPQWKLPAGWRQEPGGGMRFATLKIEPGDAAPVKKPLELTVIRLPTNEQNELEYVLKNVNRWRGQLSAPPLDAEQLAAESKRVGLDGAEAVVVSISGVLAPDMGMSAPSGAGGPGLGGGNVPGGGLGPGGGNGD